MTKIYAGIGSRETPQNILNMMALAARQLSEDGWLLRSGGAHGADSAFAGSTLRREIHLPWAGYNNLYPKQGLGYVIPPEDPRIEEIAAAHHPYWHGLKQGARKLMCRNVTIVLGQNLDDYARMVICWTKNGALVGGTAQAMRVAYAFDIPVFNLALPEDIKRLEAFANAQTEEVVR